MATNNGAAIAAGGRGGAPDGWELHEAAADCGVAGQEHAGLRDERAD